MKKQTLISASLCLVVGLTLVSANAQAGAVVDRMDEKLLIVGINHRTAPVAVREGFRSSASPNLQMNTLE